MSSLADILKSVKKNEATTAPANPVPPAPEANVPVVEAANPLQALLDKSTGAKPAVPSPPAPAATPAPPAQPSAAADLANFDISGMQTGKQAVATPDPTVHTAVSAASYRYVEQAETAPDDATRELWTSLNTVTHALSANASSGQDGGLAYAIGSVLRHIQANPQLSDVLLPEDIGQMTRALEASYSVTIVKKAENKRKGKAATAVADDATMAGLAALGFGG